MGETAFSRTEEIYMQTHEQTAMSTALQPPKVWERFADDVYSILKRTVRIWKIFPSHHQSSSKH